MTYMELLTWYEYSKVYGPLNHAIRMEHAIGRAVAPFLSKDSNLSSLFPWPKQPPKIATPEDFMNILKAASAANKKGRKP